MLFGPPPGLANSAWRPIIQAYLNLLFLAGMPSLGKPTSWWRSPALNNEVGGSPESQHLFALASDWVVPRHNVEAVIDGLFAVGLIPVVELDHIHVQAFPSGALARFGVLFPS